MSGLIFSNILESRSYRDIEEQKLGLVLKYQDSLLEMKITIENDSDLCVSS